MKRAIISILVSADNAAPGALADQLQHRYKIDRSTISTHITQLELLGVINREHDGKLYASDPDLLVQIIQTARAWARSYHSEGGSIEAAAHYVEARRTGRRHRDSAIGGDVGALTDDA